MATKLPKSKSKKVSSVSQNSSILELRKGERSKDIRYRIQGGWPLRGTVEIGGSKNASLPLLAATFCCTGDCVLKNVPALRDIDTMLDVLRFLGAEAKVDGTTITVNTDRATSKPIPHELVSKLRGSIVLLGPLLARFGEVEMSFPGGCVLGKRPVDAHVMAFKQMGAEDKSTSDTLRLVGTLTPGEVILPEFSVTATENILLAAALTKGVTTIELAAAEPHVQDVCTFLVERGVKITGIGSHSITIASSGSILEGKTHTVISDYLEAGALILASIVSKGQVTIRGADKTHLTSFLGALKRSGAPVECLKNGDMIVDARHIALKATRVQTNIFPGFPTDLQAPFGVLLTQAEGVSRIFEVLFEGRMAYLYELEKMGAHIEILNSHQALIIGPTKLHGRMVPSNDIRAGVAMVIAALGAEGETIVTDVRYIERGYDRLEEKLRSLGADITREEA